MAVGHRQDHRTALALTLSGRMKPTAGLADWDNIRQTRGLRMVSALIDAPGVNEPEQHLTVRDLVTEDLALIPRRFRGALLSGPWLKVNRFEDIADLWIEQLAPARRLELLTALALANPRTDLLVVDSPDRHTADDAGWLPRLRQLASWTGPSARIGNAAADAPATSTGTATDTGTTAGTHPADAPIPRASRQTRLEAGVAK